MKAIAVRHGETRPALIEMDRPEPAAGEALVRTLRVGIDGTDHEVIEGNHGGYPEGATFQVLGHEAVGVVEDANGTGLDEGTVVVPTVRRPPPDQETTEYFARGEPDMAPSGGYVERGIVGAHGYMSEFFTSPAEFLLPIPDSLWEHGFLVEPVSNSEKAFDHAFASRSAFEWHPESALVLGNGPLGLLTLAMCREQFDRTYCLGRRDRPDPTVDIIESLGATYVDSRETPVSAVADAYEPMDLVYEATGYAKHAFETIDALAPNGVGVLLGIPDVWEFEIDGGALHRDFVLENKALIGSVNSNIDQYQDATETVAALDEQFLDDLVTGVFTPTEHDRAFQTGDEIIKSVVEFDTL